jgi:glyoxylase-like metal-dependent hydrolase (beta-lactamase superfamily II)
VPYTPLLVDTGTHRILIDTGAGPLAPSTGHLEESLSRAGFQASDIDVVVLSHAHPDHIGGLAREDGTIRFPNARVLMSQREYDFWHSVDLRSRLGSGSVYRSPELESLMGGWIDRYLPPVRDRLEWLAGEAEIALGIVAIDAPGHTPGHLAIAISSGYRVAVVCGRRIAYAEPGCPSGLDLDIRSGCTEAHRNAPPVARSRSHGSQHRLPLPFRRSRPFRTARHTI